MSEPTKGLRLAFTPGMLGLHFICAAGKYTDDSKGPSDMAYINSLIEEDERRRSAYDGVLTITRDVTTVSPNFTMTVRVSEPGEPRKPMLTDRADELIRELHR